MKLDIQDLQPEEAVFEVSGKPGKLYTLNKLTLRGRIWLNKRFTQEQIKSMFETQNIGDVSEIAYYLLKDKSDFPTLEEFQDSFVTQKDFVALMKSLLATIGISEPVMQELSKEYDSGNVPSPVAPTGDSSTTSLPQNTATP